MKLTWDPAKRSSNLTKHGLDFRDVELVFQHPLMRRMSVRNDERRVVCVGMLADVCVITVLVVRGQSIHVISMRKAGRHERKIYQKRLKEAQSDEG